MLRFLAVAALLALAETAGAQHYPQTRKGFTAAIGLGAASTVRTCDDCNSNRSNTLGMRITLGGALRQNLILAGDIEGVSREERG